MTLDAIRKELKEVRYYYARRAIFDKALREVGNKNIMDFVKKYNDAVSTASPKLYDIYISLYVNYHTQEQLSEELNYSPDYVRKRNKDLLKFLQNKLNKQEAK